MAPCTVAKRTHAANELATSALSVGSMGISGETDGQIGQVRAFLDP